MLLSLKFNLHLLTMFPDWICLKRAEKRKLISTSDKVALFFIFFLTDSIFFNPVFFNVQGNLDGDLGTAFSQCGQIWRNFAPLATKISLWHSVWPVKIRDFGTFRKIAWRWFGQNNCCPGLWKVAESIKIAKSGHIEKICNHLVTLLSHHLSQKQIVEWMVHISQEEKRKKRA